MNTISSIAVSGVQAASTRLDAAARNIANSQTANYQREIVQQSTEKNEGVVTSVGKSDEIGPDLAADLVEQMSASYAYKANLHTIETQDHMTGSILDIKA